MGTKDQVAWANANITVAGETTPYSRGSLLPETTTPEEAAERSTLRLIGAIRTVEVVYTPEELAEQARSRGAASAAREAALDVDPAAPLGQQVAGGRETGPPTMVEPSGSPVVIGDEELRAEHEKADREASHRAGEAAKAREAQPPASASKATWVDYAVDHRGADRADAEGMTRDQLVTQYRDSGQLTSGPPTAMDKAAQAQAADAEARRQQGQGGQQQPAQQEATPPGQAGKAQDQATSQARRSGSTG
jgi:hypothetical protein